MATGQVLFQRFYYSKSFVKHNMEVIVRYTKSVDVVDKEFLAW